MGAAVSTRQPTPPSPAGQAAGGDLVCCLQISITSPAATVGSLVETWPPQGEGTTAGLATDSTATGSGDMTKMRKALILAAVSAMLSLPYTAAADTTVKAKLVSLNGSGAHGTATLTATGEGGLMVVIRSEGLVPGQPHPQHIHGSTSGGHFMCPTVKGNDTDGDGVLTNEEATGEYGTIFFALTTRGGATPTDGLDVARMPVADSKGRLNYERTFRASEV